MNLEWVVGTKITVEARRINIKEDQLVVPWESWCVLTPGVGKSKWRTAVSHQTLKVTLQVRLVEISVGSWLVAEVVSFIFWNWEVCHQLFSASRHFWSSSLLQWPLSAATGILVVFLTWEVTIHGKYISQGYKLRLLSDSRDTTNMVVKHCPENLLKLECISMKSFLGAQPLPWLQIVIVWHWSKVIPLELNMAKW